LYDNIAEEREEIMRPKARSEALIVETLPNETLIYDERANKAHCLNGTAALVWKLADGRKSVDDIARRLTKEMSVRDARNVVWATLDQLDKAKLLDVAPARSDGRRMSRRELGRLGARAALVAIPVVLTIAAPTAAQTTSCLPAGSSCIVGGKSVCCPGLKCTGNPFKTCT
jgi:hypothetical protein